MGDWEGVFKKGERFFLEPHEDMRRVAALLRKEGVRRVLDLGCGSGRNAVFLAQAGFDVYGMDISPSGLRLAKQWLEEANEHATLKRADCYGEFPFPDGFFDAVISVQVIHHNRIGKIRACIAEIARVLRKGGVAFITVPKTRRNAYRSSTRTIAPRTFVPLDGHEIGTPHYLFTKELLRKEFRGFAMLDIHVDSGKHYCVTCLRD